MSELWRLGDLRIGDKEVVLNCSVRFVSSKEYTSNPQMEPGTGRPATGTCQPQQCGRFEKSSRGWWWAEGRVARAEALNSSQYDHGPPWVLLITVGQIVTHTPVLITHWGHHSSTKAGAAHGLAWPANALFHQGLMYFKKIGPPLCKKIPATCVCSGRSTILSQVFHLAIPVDFIALQGSVREGLPSDSSGMSRSHLTAKFPAGQGPGIPFKVRSHWQGTLSHGICSLALFLIQQQSYKIRGNTCPKFLRKFLGPLTPQWR